MKEISLEASQSGSKPDSTSTMLPDVSEQNQSAEALCLDQVGMGRVQLPLPVQVGKDVWQIPALIDVCVSLDQPQAKGIHMSRLYNILTESFQGDGVTPLKMFKTLDQLKESQRGLSESAYLRAEFQLPLMRKALLSELAGWRQYPVVWQAELVEGEKKWICGFEVLYSSTCPCSTALSEQILAEKLESEPFQTGKSYSLPATPHAQRSRATVWLEWTAASIIPSMESLIDQVEKVLGTPVQTAVKRVDEQEFARLNAQNQMFCEDAARKLKGWLEKQSQIQDYWIEVCHEESLHAHNAVARSVKGRPQGFRVSQKP